MRQLYQLLAFGLGAFALATAAGAQDKPGYWDRLDTSTPEYVRELCGRSMKRDCLVHFRDSTLPKELSEQVKFDVLQLLAQQVFEWNTADLDGFMSGYWDSPDLRFVSGDSVMMGFDAAAQRYADRYPNRQAMGDLSFSQLHVRPVAEDAALVFGHWRLKRENDNPGGTFYLRVQQFDGEWKIVEDVTQSE